MFVTEESFTSHYFHNDYLGSARLVTDESGGTYWSRDYYAYGGDLRGNGTNIDYSWIGAQTNQDGVTYNCVFRQYDTNLDRWNSIDPLWKINANCSPYAYSLNNPIRFSDPFGLDGEQKIYQYRDVICEAWRFSQSTNVDAFGNYHESGSSGSFGSFIYDTSFQNDGGYPKLLPRPSRGLGTIKLLYDIPYFSFPENQGQTWSAESERQVMLGFGTAVGLIAGLSIGSYVIPSIFRAASAVYANALYQYGEAYYAATLLSTAFPRTYNTVMDIGYALLKQAPYSYDSPSIYFWLAIRVGPSYYSMFF